MTLAHPCGLSTREGTNEDAPTGLQLDSCSIQKVIHCGFIREARLNGVLSTTAKFLLRLQGKSFTEWSLHSICRSARVWLYANYFCRLTPTSNKAIPSTSCGVLKNVRLAPAAALDIREPTADVQQFDSSKVASAGLQSPVTTLEETFKLSGKLCKFSLHLQGWP